MVTYAVRKRKAEGGIKRLGEAPPRYVTSRRTAYSRFYGLLSGADPAIAGVVVPQRDIDSEIAALYEQLASLAERRALGDRGPDLEREIGAAFSRLRRLQTLQAAEITRRFRESMKLSPEDFRRLDEADRFLRERENSPGPYDTPE